MNTSVLIITFNEEVNLPECLKSLSSYDDVVVLDSFSSDKTERIARDAGVRFHQRRFDNYAAQRNYGLNEIKYKHTWLLMVDADEVVTPALAKEIENTLSSSPEDICLYRMRRKDHFLGAWIKRSSGYPTWFGRLMQIGRVRIERSINEEYVTDGEIGHLHEHLHHFPFRKGFSHWLERHNRYSTMEAELIYQGNLAVPKFLEFFNRDPLIRRRAVKALVYRLPFKSLLMFLVLYVVRGGFLDGRPGLIFCLLRSFYEFMISCKVIELRFRDKGQAL